MNLQINLYSPPSSFLPFHTITLLPSKTNFTVPSLNRRFTFLRHRHTALNFKIVRSSMEENKVKFLEAEEAEILLSTCITRTLPPALTLESGLELIRDSIEELKSKPTRAKAGMFRFQIAVSPGSKALSWFCSQDPSLGVFPQFFLSTGIEKPTNKLLSFSRTHGVFGIGAALFIKTPFSSNSIEEIPFRRIHSFDSSHLMAYGLFGHTSLKYENKSLYMFIPQIELVESNGISILTATLAWNNNDSSLCGYEEAFDVITYLTTALTRPITEECLNKSVNAVLKKYNMVEDENAQMVYKDALLLKGDFLDNTQLEHSISSSQFSLRLSPTLAISNNMLDQSRDISRVLEESSNINTLWASLIIEECYRLGITYFCIAPGSRSTPLAIAATSHPMTTCTACFDERSLAFHAIGYARGCHHPAVVITSSGTAVSNLLPAVVEASQDFLPLLLLTADRPPELLDTGANQAINQVNIFGTFVRHFINLAVPTDKITARMVLTTFDSAINHATSSPCGPVHINCPLREPLENTRKAWDQICLKGLEFWYASGQAFTSYFKPRNSFTHGDVADVIRVIKGAKRGLLLIGAVFNEDDIWGVLVLAKHLQWPVFADILSGLRLRKYKNYLSKLNESVVFIDHLDHMLLSDEVREWINPDVILQIGSRITSKRVSQMVQDCSPCPYILVDNHPNRHDPSHIITHRIQGHIGHFTDCVVKSFTSNINHQWTSFLRSINMMVEWEISFLINSQNSLSEPYVARMTSERLEFGNTMFIGNSMPIRDADMYGSSQSEGSHGNITKLPSGFPLWIQVAGNRGASGIDGLLSTAIGFSVGHNKRVVCVIGDVSFLHDTNGLALLKQRMSRKQMTIIVINNHGGAIFSLLPIANKAEEKILNQYFYTSHNIGIHNLCVAHGVKHVHVSTKADLQNAILKSQQEESDCVIEVESSIDANKNFHSNLRLFACQVASNALSTISHLSVLNSIKVHKLEFFHYRIKLSAPLTTTPIGNDNYYREGFVLNLYLEDGSTGIGEVAPLGTHKGNLLEAQEQLQFLSHVIKGVFLNSSLPLLKGSFSSWIYTNLGIPPDSLLPSVRCGLEMAILNAIAKSKDSTLLSILYPLSPKQECPQKSSNITICALLDSNGTPVEVANLATKLVEEGFTTIKIKVARRASPIEDAEVVKEIRKKIGYHIQLRADANKKWSYNEAILFGLNVKDCGLQYIEEPVNDEDDIIKFCEESGLYVALDETIDNLQENPLQVLEKFTHEKIIAVVIKPSFVGGFEKAAFIARWAHQHGKMAVVSAAFESGISLSAYVQFSCFLEMQNKEICKLMGKENVDDVAHGLGTYKWLKDDVITESLCVRHGQASVFEAGQTLTNFKINQNSVIKHYKDEKVRNYELNVEVDGMTFLINVKELGDEKNDNIIVFLHGFLGTSEDWTPIMTAMSASSRCIAIDLPGHGKSKMHANDDVAQGVDLSMKVVGDMLKKLFLLLTNKKVTLVGYSMGARITLYMAIKYNTMVKGVVMISGSPGLDDDLKRKVRMVKDDSLACALISYGLEFFIKTWYSGQLWESLKSHPQFDQIVVDRSKHDDMAALAKALSGLSTGRQPSLWEDLKDVKSPVLVIVGERDLKFKKIAHSMCEKLGNGKVVEICNCGHAVHIENPLLVIRLIREFLTSLKEGK